MDTLIIPGGTVIHLYGLPLLLTRDTFAHANHVNFKTRQDDFGEFPVRWIEGPVETTR